MTCQPTRASVSGAGARKSSISLDRLRLEVDRNRPDGRGCFAPWRAHGRLPPVFDTLAVAQQLAAGGVDRDQAEVIAKAIHDGRLEQGDHVTSDQFRAGFAEVRAEIANLDTRLSTQITELRTGVANLETRSACSQTRRSAIGFRAYQDGR